MSMWSAGITLFLVLDPFGNGLIVMALLAELPTTRQRWIIVRENLIALGILLVFLLFGPTLLAAIGVRGPALGVAGGVVLFLIGLRMTFARISELWGAETAAGEPLLVPVATPLLAGPSAVATVMLLPGLRPHAVGDWLAVLLGAWAASFAILLLAPALGRWLGRRILTAAQRLMGMLLLLIAVQMILSGISGYFANPAAP